MESSLYLSCKFRAEGSEWFVARKPATERNGPIERAAELLKTPEKASATSIKSNICATTNTITGKLVLGALAADLAPGSIFNMAEEGRLVRSLKSQTLDLPPSCIEFCPAFPSYFLVGTYSLQTEPESSTPSNADADAEAEENDRPKQSKQPQSRNGSIIAFQLADEDVWVESLVVFRVQC